MPRILLVYPNGGEIGMLGHHPFYDLVGMLPHMPPLGLATVAGYLPRDWDVRLLDENVAPIDDDALADCDYVFLSGMYPHKDALCRMAERASALGKHVIAGGPFVTGSAEKLRGQHGIHTLCINEVENYAEQLVADLAAGTVQAEYGRIGERADMSKVAVPRFDLVPDISKYAMISIQVSRGCPFDCEFCDVPTLVGRKMRYKTPEQVVAELDALKAVITQQGVQVFICDDNLTGHLKRCRDVLRAMADWGRRNGYPFAFLTQLSMNVADDAELLDLLYEANVRTVITGVESANEASLIEAGKQHNLKRSIVDRVEAMLRAGIEVYAYLVVGFDSDGPDIFDRNLELIEQARITYAETSILVAMDNTPLGARMEREERLLFNTATEAQQVLENYKVGMTNFETRLEPRQLQDGYAHMLESLLEPERWYARTRAMVEILPERDREHHMTSLRLRFDSLFILVCCLIWFPRRLLMLRQALACGRGGSWRFWRFLLSVFAVGLTRPEYLKKANRVRGFLRSNAVSDPSRGRPRASLAARPLRVVS